MALVSQTCKSYAQKHKDSDPITDFWLLYNGNLFQLSAKLAPYLQKTAEVNVYNYLASLRLAPSNNEITMFLNKPQVQSALHVKKMEYEMLNNNVYMYLYDDLYKTVKPCLEELLEHYAVMCFK